MNYEVKTLPKSQREVRVTLTPDEVQPFMEKTAGDLAQRVKIEGFRPGKASYDVIKGRFGEAAILEEALPDVIQKFFVEIVRKDNIETIGEPKVNVEKAAPGNEVVFSVTVAIMPHVTRRPELKKIRIKPKDARIEAAEVERVVGELRKMQATEHEVDREVGPKDKATVDMTMSLDRVPVEGGAAKGHAIYLAEPHYVPGLNEKLHGMKKGETRNFKLNFPKDHYQKMIAGKDVDFEVKLTNLHEIRHPDVDDAFAKALGQESMDKLRDLLRKNLENEAGAKEHQRQEIAVLEELIKESRFDDIPDFLVNTETHKMMHELEHSIEHQGLEFAEYLKSIKKTVDQVLMDFIPEAIKRVKGAIVIREVGLSEKIEPDDKAVVEEQVRLINQYKDDAGTQERLRSEEGLAYIRTMLCNRLVMEHLRKTCVA